MSEDNAEFALPGDDTEFALPGDDTEFILPEDSTGNSTEGAPVEAITDQEAENASEE